MECRKRASHVAAIVAAGVCFQAAPAPAHASDIMPAAVSRLESLDSDSRIGGSRQGAIDVALDFDGATGNLFAVVAWGGSDPGWSVNISPDDGITWAETFFWSTGAVVDAAVVGQYLYVAYSSEGDAGVARTRRFFVADGTPDTTYGGLGYHTVADVSPATVADISVCADVEHTDDRIYCAFIESNHAVRFYWDEAWDGTTWTGMSPTGTSAASGLDCHWGGGTMGSDPNVLWLSYLGTDGSVHMLGKTAADSWNNYSVSPDSVGPRTRVSAHGNTVFVGYLVEGVYAFAAAYHVSYDNGVSWDCGYAYDPLAGEPSCYGVDITARGGWGSAVVFGRDESAFDPVYVVTRKGYASGSWDPPEDFNEFNALTAAPSFIQYLGTLEAFGMVYFAGMSSNAAVPYFDVIGLLPFADGFESGDPSAWSLTVP